MKLSEENVAYDTQVIKYFKLAKNQKLFERGGIKTIQAKPAYFSDSCPDTFP